MTHPVLYLPVFTTILSLPFAALVFRRYLDRGRPPHLLWWTAGIIAFGAGTFTEALTAIGGWHEGLFRAWYITGALLGGAPLAQGTVYLLLPRKVANRMAAGLAVFVTIAATFVLLTPVNASLATANGLSPSVIEWTWVRAFSPFINTYAAIFLAGGAIYSAARYRARGDAPIRVRANVLIAVGAILPGIGGSFTRMGYTEVLYVTELAGLLAFFAGYRASVGDGAAAVTPLPQLAAETAG